MYIPQFILGFIAGVVVAIVGIAIWRLGITGGRSEEEGENKGDYHDF